jgi:hypothetical protein
MEGLPFQTTTQLVALLLALVGGLFLGLSMRPRGNRWRERYQDKDLEHVRYRDRVDVELRERDRRIRELEAEVARLSAR